RAYATDQEEEDWERLACLFEEPAEEDWESLTAVGYSRNTDEESDDAQREEDKEGQDMLFATSEVAIAGSIQVVQDCTKADDSSATVNRSLESTAMKISRQGDEDFLDKVIPDMEHHEFKHVTGTDVTEVDGKSEDPEDIDCRQVEFELIRHQGTD
ncbi:hypothetical protein scyTo_0008824, partial [Scyliorhinus torazame]|nr:hypothetical protein [Scyliorhinus torazame]